MGQNKYSQKAFNRINENIQLETLREVNMWDNSDRCVCFQSKEKKVNSEKLMCIRRIWNPLLRKINFFLKLTSRGLLQKYHHARPCGIHFPSLLSLLASPILQTTHFPNKLLVISVKFYLVHSINRFQVKVFYELPGNLSDNRGFNNFPQLLKPDGCYIKSYRIVHSWKGKSKMIRSDSRCGK